MPKLVVVPHNRKSSAAKELANTLSRKLGYKVYRVTEEKIRRRIPFRLRGGTDKLTQLNNFNRDNIPCPEFTTDRAVAEGWINEGCVVMCRTLLMSSEGKGIVVAETREQLVNARLYTKYFKKKEEYRVHVLNGQVIDVQQKRKKRGNDANDAHIRNLSNGYVFCRDGITRPEGIEELAIRAVRSLGYSLGAVDIARNVHYDRMIVLEVNANPGMQGTTLENYANKIIEDLL